MQQTLHPLVSTNLTTLVPLWLWMNNRRSGVPRQESPGDPTLVDGGSHTPDNNLEGDGADHTAISFDPQTWDLLETKLTDQLTSLSQNLAKAREIQQGFFPRTVPTVPNLELLIRLRPASELSGDYYDFIFDKPGDLIFSIGDVASKGVSAAVLVPAICKVMRSAVRFLDNPSPESLLTYIHEDLYNELSQSAMFVTTFIGRYQPATRTLFYANAGHAPVIYRPAYDQARLLRADGAPIGLLPQNSWCNRQLVLAPGDLLLIATDGVTEVRNREQSLFGYERLLTFVDQMAGAPIETIAHELFTAIMRFAPDFSGEDDQTLMILRGV